MSYTTTTSTRRLFKLKVKTGPKSGWPAPRKPGDDAMLASAREIPVPPLFERSRALPAALAVRSRWWQYSMWLALAATLCGATYYAAQSGTRVDRRSPERQAMASIAPNITPGFNMRPMRLSSGAHSAAGAAQQMDPSAGLAGSSARRDMSDTASDRRERQAPGSLPANDEVLHAMLDGRSKVVLPADVAGNCNLGDRGIKDLGSCLVRNGARAE